MFTAPPPLASIGRTNSANANLGNGVAGRPKLTKSNTNPRIRTDSGDVSAGIAGVCNIE